MGDIKSISFALFNIGTLGVLMMHSHHIDRVCYLLCSIVCYFNSTLCCATIAVERLSIYCSSPDCPYGVRRMHASCSCKRLFLWTATTMKSDAAINLPTYHLRPAANPTTSTEAHDKAYANKNNIETANAYNKFHPLIWLRAFCLPRLIIPMPSFD